MNYGEIEDKLNKLPYINSCAVVKKVDKNSHDVLCAYFTADSKIDVLEIQKALGEFLPKYMIPAYYKQMDMLPHTPNGKIDRKKLPDPVFKTSNREIIKPRNDVDKELISILCELLKQDSLSLDDSFFELGGDSLLAISLCAIVQNRFNAKIFVKDIIDHPIIMDLSDLISENMNKLSVPVLKHVAPADYYKLSSAQTRMYYSSKISGNNSVLYNIPGAIIVDGVLDIDKLEKCFNKIIERHESLRTYFVIEENTVVQKIDENVQFNLETLDNADFNNFDEIFRSFIRPFDLEKAPLFRVKFIKFTNNKSAILLDMHHIVSDGKSISILINEICQLYNNLDANLPNLEFTYKDFTSLLDDKVFKENYNEAEKYWLKQFEGEIPVLNMPTMNVRPATQSFEGMRVYKKLDNSTFDTINDLSKRLHVTPYMILLSAYYILLSKYTGQDDIIIGSPSVGRDLEASQSIIGMFVNTFPLRNKVDNSLSVLEFLESLKNNLVDDFKYQFYPFNDLVDKLNIKRDASRNPLFDVMFIYQNNGYENINIDGIKATYKIPDTKTSKFDLSLEAVPINETINLTFEFSTKLFNKEFIENLSENFVNILNVITNNINIKIADIDMLSEDVKQKILYGFNDTQKDYPNKTFSTLFEEQVEKTPNNIALVFGDKSLTFRELNEKANSLAYYLRNTQHVEKESLVGVMVNRSLEMIIAILAVMKSGGAYIPIDPGFPEDRINYMLSSSSASVLLTNKKLESKIDFEHKVTIDLDNNDIYSLPNENIENINTLDDLLYVIFTSGSTGRPKGVLQTQKTLVNFAHYCNDYVGYLKEPKNQAIVSISTVSFDIFSYEALIPLQRGVKVVIANEDEQTMPKLLNDLMVKNAVTATQATPSVMQVFVNNIDSIPALKNIKYLTLTGEQVPITLVRELKDLGNITIYDGYGPTETYYCTLSEVNTDFITIGKPFYNDQMYILDDNMMPVPVGVIGEIYISGDGVSKGYLNNIDLTSKSFLNNPFMSGKTMYKSGDLGKYLENGDILCLGRKDNQIKIRGLRIELGEIEALISKYPNIEKTVIVKQNMNNREFISAYFVANKRISVDELRRYLAKRLPRYMIPSYYIALDDFPYTPNGKIDRKKLPMPKEVLNISKENYVPPKTDLQKQLVSIFEKVLNTKPIGIHDNFFELGGDSLLAMSLNIELLEFTNKVSYSDIFKFSTVAELEDKINSDNNKPILNKFENLPGGALDILNKTTKKSKIEEYHPKNILLTGSTGFLGIHILDEFLKNENGKIYCIVRKEPGMSITTKLAQKLNYYFGNKYNNLINNRIIPVTGDICKPNFGLSQEDLQKIVNNIDLVIHSAANVAHFGNYNNFYMTNVTSVKYIIDFCKDFNKKLYHISTTGVSGKKLDLSYVLLKKSIRHLVNPEFCEDSLYIGQLLDNVYTHSKFEAEAAVLDAISKNVDAYILRMGNLMPRLSDGLFQENILQNAFVTKLAAFMKLGIIPDYLLKSPLEFTPVDSAAQAVYKIITHPSEKNRVFHIYNHKTVALGKFLKLIKKFDYNVKVLPENEFKTTAINILKNDEKRSSLQNIANDFDSNYHLNYNGTIKLKSNFTIKYLRKCGFKWPKIKNKYLIDFIKLLRKVI